MKEWFKARNIWGAAILDLTDEQAGKLAKAIWAYTMDGEIVPLEGSLNGTFAMIRMTLSMDDDRESEISAKRAAAGSNGGKQTQAKRANAAFASTEPVKDPDGFMVDEEAKAIQAEHDRLFNAAQDSGFKMTNNVHASLLALYAENGLDKMLYGLKECSEHGVPTLAYLRAVLKGEPKKQKPKVKAQDFPQRDYSGVQDDMMASLAEEIEAFNSKEGA